MMEIKNLCFRYKGCPAVLKDVSFSVESGQFLAILGNNGVGKSTLLKCFNHILKPDAGEVVLDGENLLAKSTREVAKQVAFVSQSVPNTQMTVHDVVMLGCSVGKGNLLFHMRGKSAYSFYNRKTGKSVRLVLKSRPQGLTREESFAYYQSCKPEEMFDVKETTIRLPEKARLFDSYTCDCCGEVAGANWIRLAADKKLCLDCYESYNRFDV